MSNKAKKTELVSFALLFLLLCPALLSILQYALALSLDGLCAISAKASPTDLGTKTDIASLFCAGNLPVDSGQLLRLPALALDGSLKNAALEWAADDFFSSYMQSLTPDKRYKKSSEDAEARGISLVQPDRFPDCVRLLSARATFYQTVLHLTYLAEAYQRCAVWQTRKRCEASKNDKRIAAETKAEGEFLLAEELNRLGLIYRQHGKLQIAGRAYEDALETAESACDLDAVPNNLQRLRQHYFALAEFLVSTDEDEDAVSILSNMLSEFED